MERFAALKTEFYRCIDMDGICTPVLAEQDSNRLKFAHVYVGTHTEKI